MSDLVSRLRNPRLLVNLRYGHDLCREAADRIEALERELAMEQRLSFRQQLHANAERDEALLRQALDALVILGMNYAIGPKHWPAADAAIAALRARLGETT